jgi:trehalose/maltose hydrolase-like predicted phosphorylase
MAQRALRFAVYHLNSAVNPKDEHASIGARALTGSTYKGHVFWDTEIYLLPFYTFTDPPAARTLLQYRFHTLPAARDRARRLGYQGALYAWESADTGEDVTPDTVIAPDGRVVQVLTGFRSTISAPISPMRSGNTGRRRRMRPFFSRQVRTCSSRPRDSGRVVGG